MLRPLTKRSECHSVRTVTTASWSLAIALAWLGMAGACSGQSFEDLFANRQTFTNAAGLLTASNAGATVEPGEPKHGGKTGGHSLWISWVAPSNGVARFRTETSGFDTLLSAYYFLSTNDTNFAQLVEAARNDDSDELGDRESTIEFGVRAGQRFEVAVDGYFGAVGDIKFRWSLDVSPNPPPTVLSTPPDATHQIGDSVTLTVGLANVSGGTKFKWYFNGVELVPEEKNPTLTIPSMQVTNVGRYKLLIDAGQNITFFAIPTDLQINTEGAAALAQSKFPDAPGTALIGSDGSLGPALRLAPAGPRPAPRAAAGFGVVRGYNGSQIFDTTYATTDPAEPAHCTVPAGPSYWLTYQPPVNGTITIDTAGSTYETVLEVYTYDAPPINYQDLISVACDHGSVGTGSRVGVPVVRSRQYLVAIDGVGGSRGLARLNYSLNTNQLPQAPTLLSLPQTQVVTNGSSVLLAPAIIASPPLKCLWRKDGKLLANSNSASLHLVNVTPADSGGYLVAITNDLGGLETTLPLRVVIPTRPQLRSVPGGISLGFPTFLGQRYTLEEADSITGPWLQRFTPIIGDGSAFMTNFPAAGLRYYRLKLE